MDQRGVSHYLKILDQFLVLEEGGKQNLSDSIYVAYEYVMLLSLLYYQSPYKMS